MKVIKYIIIAVIGIILYGAIFGEDTPHNELNDSKLRAEILLTSEAKGVIKYPATFKRVEFLSVKHSDTLTSKLYYTASNSFGVPVQRCARLWVLLNEDDSINPKGGGDVEHGECKH